MKGAWIPPTRNTATRSSFLDGLIFDLIPELTILALFLLFGWLR